MGKQKAFVASNFQVAIDGLDCTKVSKVDSFTIKAKSRPTTSARVASVEAGGDARVPEPEDHARRGERQDVG